VARALETFTTDLTALLRHVTWVREGAPRPCRWCDGHVFVFVRRPHDADDTVDGKHMRIVGHSDHGHLDALICRDCGHVEWFVSDPQRLPVGTSGVVLVEMRTTTPYRE
jgi:hypothetical protein